MNSLEKIIFNELASRRAVWLPEVGTLYVEQRAASVEGRDRITPPANKVEFSRNQTEGSRSAVDLLEGAGVERGAAEEQYRSWLDGARTDTGIRIEGVGELKRGFFTPSAELGKLLNPYIGNTQQKLPLSGREKGLIVLIVVCVVVLAGGWYWWWKCGSADEPFYNNARRHSQYRTAVDGGSSAQPQTAGAGDAAQGSATTTDSTMPDTTARHEGSALTDATGNAQTDTGAASHPETQSGNSTAQTGTTAVTNTTASGSQDSRPAATQQAVAASGPRYYIVAAMFSSDANADKYIGKQKKRFPDVAFEKVPYAGSKIIVSVFSTTDEAQAAQTRRRMSAEMNDPELWVYKKKK